MPEIAGQRPAPASLTRGNINNFHRAGTSLRGKFPTNRENNRGFYENRAVW